MNDRDKQIEDMEKAMFYLKDEIEMLKRKRNDFSLLSIKKTT